MPVCLAPSAIFPIASSVPMSTEARDSFKAPKAGAQVSEPKPYRGPNIPRAKDQVLQEHEDVTMQLKSLTARLEALSSTISSAAEAAPAEPAPAASARPAQLEASGLPVTSTQLPWEGSTYATFAGYAGEASRVRNAGRLAFGSDSKKMAV